MLTTRYKAAFNAVFDPIAKVIARTGIHPTVITWAGAALTGVVCLVLLLTNDLLLFCVLLCFAGLSDALDGAVARVSGKVSKEGAYADAMADRYVECAVVLTVAHVTGYWVPSALFLSGSMLMSYAKARAAIEVPVANTEWPDLAERTERAVLYLLGLFLSLWVPWQPLGRDIFWWTLVLLSGFVHLSVVQRMRRAKRLIRERA